MLKLLDLLATLKIDLSIKNTKIHLAQSSSDSSANNNEPLQEYLKGGFSKWQNWQNKKNFECNHIVSLINIEPDMWLFAGVHTPGEAVVVDDHYEYNSKLLPGQESMIGHIIVRYRKTARNAYRWAETVTHELEVEEYRSQKFEILDFPGFNSVRVSFSQLTTIFKQRTKSWRGALSNVKGVYLITDTSTGKCYVGSATGSGGIWDRWQCYIETGHGNNLGLINILSTAPDYSTNFQFSILEIADTNTPDKFILARESHWKDILSSRQHGYNQN